MADSEKLAFEVDVKGSEQTIESMKDLKAAIKAAKDEQLKAASVYGESSKEFIEASKNVSKLKDKVEDLNDSTKSLKGSGVERASEGFNQLGEGLRNLDFDKVKVGLVAMKSALAAVGIGLIVQAVTYLVENFDELSKGSGLLAKALQFIGGIVTGLKDAFLKFGDILQGINPELRGMSTEIDKLKESMNGLLSEQIGKIDRLIALNKANGESTIAYENLKQEAIIKTNKLYVDSIINYVKAGGQLNDEQKKQLSASLENIANAKTQQQVLEVTEDKKRTDAEQKAYLDRQANAKRHKDEMLRIQAEEADAWWAERLAEEAQNKKEDEAAKQKEVDDQARLEKIAADQDAQMQRYTDNKNKEAQIAEETENKKREQQLETFNQYMDGTKSSLQSAQQINDIFFNYKLNKHKGDAKAENEIRKKQFNVNKAFGITNAVIDGIGAVQKALNNPYPLNIVLAAISGAAAIANVAKIASTKFEPSGGDTGGGGGGAVAVPIPTPPTINTPNANTNSSTSFDETGKKVGEAEKQGQPTINVKATVGVDEITDKSNRVQVLEKQSTF